MEPSCDECEDSIANVVCYECGPEGKWYCFDCSGTIHQLKKRQNHEITFLRTQEDEDVPSPTTLQQQQQHPNIEEFDIYLPKLSQTSVGICLHQPGESVFVAAFTPNEFGDKSGRDLNADIRIGDVIIQIGNLDIIGKPIEQVLDILEESNSPVKLRCIRGNVPPDELLYAHTMKFKNEAEIEHQHEIICLEPTEKGYYTLTVNDRNCDYLAMDDSDVKVPVFSFLGNTTAGKSFIIKSLMSETEITPFCFEEDKMCSTTANANLFSTDNIVECSRVNIIDFEGENGLSPFMDMVRKTKDLLTLHSGSENKQRHLAVKEYFPKIAYLLSDVIVLVGDTSLVNKDYFTRCCEFAEKANKGVSETMCRPSLVIIHNKCSLASNFDVPSTTQEFLQAHIYNEYEMTIENAIEELYCIEGGDPQYCGLFTCTSEAGLLHNKYSPGDLILGINNEPAMGLTAVEIMERIAGETSVTFHMRPLKSNSAVGNGFLDYFAEIVCIRLPRGDIRQNIRGKWYNGDQILANQLLQVKHTLHDMAYKQMKMRFDITVGEKGWFFLLKAIVQDVASNRPVSFSSLLSQLLSSGDKDVDRMRDIFLRVYRRKVIRTFTWYSECVHFVIQVFARMIAVNMCRQADASILTRETVSSHARKSLDRLLATLARYVPCCATYPFQPQYVCGQHRMFHTSNGHRTCERIPDSNSYINQWFRHALVSRHHVWPGVFECPEMPTDFLNIERWEKTFIDSVYCIVNPRQPKMRFGPPTSLATARVVSTSDFDGEAQSPAAKMNDAMFIDTLNIHAVPMRLQFRVFGDASMQHIPCLRCFRGCAHSTNANKATTPTKMKMKLMQWHSKLELSYFSPDHLAVCTPCKPFFQGLQYLIN